MFKLLLGAAVGFAAAWFLDPNDGTRRRKTLQDKAMSYARKGKQDVARKADYAAGQVKGAASSATPGSGRPPAEERLNDPALARKVESEAFRDVAIPSGSVSVNVEYGVVYLRGEAPSREAIDELVRPRPRGRGRARGREPHAHPRRASARQGRSPRAGGRGCGLDTEPIWQFKTGTCRRAELQPKSAAGSGCGSISWSKASNRHASSWSQPLVHRADGFDVLPRHRPPSIPLGTVA
jgi:hypothetical protein